jgi:hypothetical protein
MQCPLAMYSTEEITGFAFATTKNATLRMTRDAPFARAHARRREGNSQVGRQAQKDRLRLFSTMCRFSPARGRVGC